MPGFEVETERELRSSGKPYAWSDAFFAFLVRESHDPVYLISPADSFRLCYVNAATCAHFGKSEEELLSLTIPDWDPRFTPEDCVRFWNQLKQTKRSILETEHLVGGKVVPVQVTASYFCFNDQEYIGGVIQDISERKKSEETIRRLASDLGRSNEELKQFSYVASHDLQEPLNTVIGYLSLLRDETPKDEFADKMIDVTIEATDRMKRLITSLLEYTRSEEAPLTKTPTDLKKLVEQVAETLSYSIQQANAELIVGPLPTLSIDPILIGQLFQNLISNAVKFRGDKPPRVTVSAHRAGNSWVFSVSDNGIGIDKKFHEKVFRIFQRLSDTRKYAGAGLGLAICKKIVDRHQGKIWLESTPGKGTTFSFELAGS